MDLGSDAARAEVPAATEAVILLDTHAVVWLERGHPRVRELVRSRQRLFISPATLLELQLLDETGRVRVRGGAQALAGDDRWALDDPPAAAWFAVAGDLTWTRDPFDRLLAAHAQFRGWKLATADASCLANLGPRHTIDL